MNRDEVRHELRTPLTVIKGVLRLLQHPAAGDLPPATWSELVAKANAQVACLERAIESVEDQFGEPSDDVVIVLYEEPMAGSPVG